MKYVLTLVLLFVLPTAYAAKEEKKPKDVKDFAWNVKGAAEHPLFNALNTEAEKWQGNGYVSLAKEAGGIYCQQLFNEADQVNALYTNCRISRTMKQDMLEKSFAGLSVESVATPDQKGEIKVIGQLYLAKLNDDKYAHAYTPVCTVKNKKYKLSSCLGLWAGKFIDNSDKKNQAAARKSSAEVLNNLNDALTLREVTQTEKDEVLNSVSQAGHVALIADSEGRTMTLHYAVIVGEEYSIPEVLYSFNTKDIQTDTLKKTIGGDGDQKEKKSRVENVTNSYLLGLGPTLTRVRAHLTAVIGKIE